MAGSEVIDVKPGEAIINEGDISDDLYIIRSGSMIVEKNLGGKPVFMSYVPAGSYSGEMAMIERAPRVATVKAAIRSHGGEVARRSVPPAAGPQARTRQADVPRRCARGARSTPSSRSRRNEFGGAVDMYSSVANFLIKQGIGEATDVLLIDESLCVGCDNCEKACADSHDGLSSRLNREAGTTFANIHVPTSCRHCEHPHCMSDCPPNAIRRGPDGEVFISDTCIGCGNCQRACPLWRDPDGQAAAQKAAALGMDAIRQGARTLASRTYAWRKKASKAERRLNRPSWRSSATCAQARLAARPVCGPVRPVLRSGSHRTPSCRSRELRRSG